MPDSSRIDRSGVPGHSVGEFGSTELDNVSRLSEGEQRSARVPHIAKLLSEVALGAAVYGSIGAGVGGAGGVVVGLAIVGPIANAVHSKKTHTPLNLSSGVKDTDFLEMHMSNAALRNPPIALNKISATEPSVTMETSSLDVSSRKSKRSGSKTRKSKKRKHSKISRAGSGDKVFWKAVGYSTAAGAAGLGTVGAAYGAKKGWQSATQRPADDDRRNDDMV